MATIDIQTVDRDGITPTTEAVAAGGDQYANDGRQWVEIWNDHASASRTTTIVTQLTVDGQAVADRTVITTAANDTSRFGPFQTNIYNDSSGFVQLTYSDSGANMRIAVFELTQS